jgi:hypothetical protein
MSDTILRKVNGIIVPISEWCTAIRERDNIDKLIFSRENYDEYFIEDIGPLSGRAVLDLSKDCLFDKTRYHYIDDIYKMVVKKARFQAHYQEGKRRLALGLPLD